MCIGNLHSTKILQNSEVNFGIYVILDKGEKGKQEPDISKMRMGDLQLIEEDGNTNGR